MHSSPRALVRLILFLCVMIGCVLVQMIAMALRLKIREIVPYIFHRLTTRVLGFHIEIHGTMSPHRPTLFVSNHVSYTDIPVLGGVIPACFVSKAEVAHWPIFGFLSKLQRTVFIERVRTQASEHKDMLQRRLEEGGSLILFPEGTTGNGQRILPFKSTLLSVAEREVHGKPLLVQGVRIAYTHIDGLPVSAHQRYRLSWVGDTGLGSHFWQMAGLGIKTVSITFHEPQSLSAAGDRKKLAQKLYLQVADTA